MLKADGVIWHGAMSVDGYVADVRDKVDFSFGHESAGNSLVDEILGGVGAILIGRRTYDLAAHKPEGAPYGGKVCVPEFVVTRRSTPAEPDPARGFLDGNDLPAAVATAREAAQGKMVIVIGPTLAASILAAGLIDQILLHIVPVLLGDGVRLMRRALPAPWRLDKLGASDAGAITNLVFQPAVPASRWKESEFP